VRLKQYNFVSVVLRCIYTDLNFGLDLIGTVYIKPKMCVWVCVCVCVFFVPYARSQFWVDLQENLACGILLPYRWLRTLSIADRTCGLALSAPGNSKLAIRRRNGLSAVSARIERR